MFLKSNELLSKNKITLSVILFLLIIFSFQWDNSSYSVDPSAVRYLTISITLFCLLIVGSLSAKYIKLRIDAVDIGITLLFLWNIIISIIHTSHISIMYNILLLFILYVLISFFYLSLSKKTLGNILLISTILILLQLLLLERFFYTFPYSSYGLLENHATLAIYLVIVGPVIFYSIESPKARIIIALVFLSIILSYSRTAIISLAIAIYIYVLITQKRKLFFLTLSAILLLVVCFLISKNTESIIGRFLVWKIIINEIEPVTLLLGNGHGYIENKILLLQSQYFESKRSIKEQLLAGSVHSSFNEYLKFLVEQGIIGLSLTIYLIYSFYKRIARSLQENKVLFISVTTFLISGLFSYPLSNFTICLILIILIAINSVNKEENKGITTLLVAKRNVLILPAIFLVFFIYHYSQNYIYVSRYNKLIAKNYMIYNESFFLDKMKKIYTNLSYNPIVVHKYAMDLYKIGLLNESLEEAIKGEKMFTNLNITMLIASIYEELGDNIQAEKYYKKCIHMIPKAFEPKYSLFEFYITTNQHQKALSVAELIKEYPVKVNSETVKKIKQSADDFILSKNKLEEKK